MPLYRQATKLGDYRPCDWGVWFNGPYLIASYDGMHTLFLRQTGETIIHTSDLEKVKVAGGLSDDLDGESYDAWF